MNDKIPRNPHPVKPPANLPPPRKESLQVENARLKAEVKRLCEAVDAIAHEISMLGPFDDEEKKAIAESLAAKKGTPQP